MELVCSLYRISALFRRVFFLMVAVFAVPMLPAQTVSFISAVSTTASGFNHAQSVAVDTAGTLYIADSGNDQIIKIAPDGTKSVLKTGSLSLSMPFGIAVDTDQGLLVPVIRDVDKKSMFDLAKDLETLAAKARDRKVTADEMKGGTFTISNQGAIGGAHFTPVVNLPEVAILGLGRGAMKPVVREGKIEARMLTPIALSYDHRVIDGGSAARFTVDLVKAFENFDEAVVKV